MPPFGDEPDEEQGDKPLNFLSFRHAAKPTANLRPRSIFGAEPAESQPDPLIAQTSSAKFKSVPKRPFQDETVEDAPTKVSRGNRLGLFGDEGEEGESGCQPATSQLFGAEGSEDDRAPSSGQGSSGEEPEDGFTVKQESVFAFGWNSVSTFKKSTFWRENMDDLKAKPKKRAYDNSKRSASAAYLREKSKGVFKRNGLDPARLSKLFDAKACLCIWGCNTLQAFV